MNSNSKLIIFSLNDLIGGIKQESIEELKVKSYELILRLAKSGCYVAVVSSHLDQKDTIDLLKKYELDQVLDCIKTQTNKEYPNSVLQPYVECMLDSEVSPKHTIAINSSYSNHLQDIGIKALIVDDIFEFNVRKYL